MNTIFHEHTKIVQTLKFNYIELNYIMPRSCLNISFNDKLKEEKNRNSYRSTNITKMRVFLKVSYLVYIYFF